MKNVSMYTKRVLFFFGQMFLFSLLTAECNINAPANSFWGMVAGLMASAVGIWIVIHNSRFAPWDKM